MLAPEGAAHCVAFLSNETFVTPRTLLNSTSKLASTSLLSGCLRDLAIASTLMAYVPVGPVEPPLILVIPAAGHDVARIVVPFGLRAADVNCVPCVRYGRPGEDATLCLLRPIDALAESSSEERNISLSFLLRHVRACASIVSPDKLDKVPIETCVRRHPGDDGSNEEALAVAVMLPADTTPGSFTELQSLTVAGEPVAVTDPPRTLVSCGLLAPLQIYDAVAFKYGPRACTPAVGALGSLYVPRPNARPKVSVFAAHGEPVAERSYGYGSPAFLTTAAVDCASGMVFLSGLGDSNSARVFAVNPSTLEPVWHYYRVEFVRCSGLALVQDTGGDGNILVTGTYSNRLYLFRALDGRHLGICNLLSNPFSLAYDAASRTLCVSFDPGMYDRASWEYPVWWFVWEDGALQSGGMVEEAGSGSASRPLAIVPSSPARVRGRLSSYLVVGELGSPDLTILALPSFTHVHRHTLEGLRVSGLAADPTGLALVVCCESITVMGGVDVHVMKWPLPGMPLEPEW